MPENFVHQKFVSDLAGYDASDHDQTPQKVIQRVAKWLRSQPDFKSPRPEAKAILGAFPQFEKLPEKVKEQSLGTLSWLDLATTAQEVVSGIPA